VKPFEQLLFFRSILVLTGMYLNRGFRRFLLRGLPKVNLEVGWISLAHNLLKKAAIDRNREMVVQG
jgi:hypothetical protein